MSAGNCEATMERSGTGMGIRKVSQIIKFSDLVDSGATGTKTLNKQIPAGSFVIGSKVTVSEGFAGDVSAVLKLGNAGDDNAYSQASTHNVFAKARNLVKSAIISADVGVIANGSDTSVIAVVTVDADYTSVSAGKMLIEVYYLSTNLELKDGPTEEIQLNQS
jgi:hypothetical protein